MGVAEERVDSNGRTAWRVLAAVAVALAALTISAAAGVRLATPAGADVVVDGCTIVSSPTPADHTDCRGVDLSNASLSGLDLSFADFAGAVFVDCGPGNPPGTYRCQVSDLSGADLRNADLAGATSTFCQAVPEPSKVCATVDLAGADLAGADLSDLQLPAAQLQGDDLTGADLAGVSFLDCGDNCFFANLTAAVLTGTSLVPGDRSAVATSAGGAVVTWPTPPALPGATPGACTPASGSAFRIGDTAVTCDIADWGGDIATGTFRVHVLAGSFSPLTITTTSTPGANRGASYSYRLGATGGTAPYSWKVVAGTGRLPKGLRLAGATGIISGTPASSATTSTFTVEVKDSRATGKPRVRNTTSARFTIAVS